MKLNSEKHTQTLVVVDPKQVLIHGPSKRYVDEYLWFSPEHGSIGCYTPTSTDVNDHFGVFRGVDQLESFGQVAVVSACAQLECTKQNCSFEDFKRDFNVVLMAVGQVYFHDFLKEGETFISVGKTQRHKFRQIEVSGRIYRVPKGFMLKSFFQNFSEKSFEAYDFPTEFTLIAEINSAIGKAIKHSKIVQNK